MPVERIPEEATAEDLGGVCTEETGAGVGAGEPGAPGVVIELEPTKAVSPVASPASWRSDLRGGVLLPAWTVSTCIPGAGAGTGTGAGEVTAELPPQLPVPPLFPPPIPKCNPNNKHICPCVK